MPKGFYRDPELKFDVAQMQSALKEVDSRVARQSPLGERDINAICLTQIPGDANSITGGNVRGLFWTKPDSTYNEVQREQPIDETKYNQFVELFEEFSEMLCNCEFNPVFLKIWNDLMRSSLCRA